MGAGRAARAGAGDRPHCRGGRRSGGLAGRRRPPAAAPRLPAGGVSRRGAGGGRRRRRALRARSLRPRPAPRRLDAGLHGLDADARHGLPAARGPRPARHGRGARRERRVRLADHRRRPRTADAAALRGRAGADHDRLGPRGLADPRQRARLARRGAGPARAREGGRLVRVADPLRAGRAALRHLPTRRSSWRSPSSRARRSSSWSSAPCG